jgi:hypothetical protein
MKTSEYLFTAVMGIAFTACSSDNNLPSEETAAPVEVQFAGELTSASSQTGTRATTQENWDKPYLSIGITPVDISGASTSGSIAQYYNVEYTTQAGGTSATFTPADDAIYFQSSKETASFAAYSPYDATLATTGNDKGVIKLAADDDFNVADYIWAKAKDVTYSSHQASFAFAHVQSKLTINVELDESVSLPESASESEEAQPTVTITKLEVAGLVASGTFNTETGVSAPAGTDPTAFVTEIATGDASDAQEFQYLIIPQTVAANSLIFTITTSKGDIYRKKFTTDTEFQAGYAYNYRITAKKYDLEVTGTITGWDEQDEEDGDAMMAETETTDNSNNN